MKELMPFAELELCERTDPESLDRELIMERRTSRLPYDSRGIDQGVVAELVRTAEQFGHRLECCSDPQEIDWVINLNAETMFYDLRDDPTRNEIGHWIRYSRLDAEKRGDGLAAFALHFPGPLMRLFFRFNRLFTLPIIYGVAQWFYKRSMRGTRTVAWISGRFEENDDCLTAGRMLARLWLTMTKHGIYLHPFGSVITNKRSHQLLKVRFAATQRGEPPWLLVRLGYGDVPPRACRLPLHDLLVSQDCNS
jgi:hypothetical protein